MSKKGEVFYQFRNPNPRPTDEAQDLPLLNQEEEFDLLKDILDLIRVHEGFSKQEGSKEENREINIMRSLLVAMTDLLKLMIEQNQSLTPLNTELRKNTIISESPA